MQSKKKSIARESASRRVSKRAQDSPVPTSFLTAEEDVTSNGKRYQQPHDENPETDEEREKRFAKREALTLRAFQMAYDNHHQGKRS